MPNVKRPRRICLVGVQGIGKSTLLRSLQDELRHIDMVLGSSLLRKLVGGDFARFDGFPDALKQSYREQVIARMREQQEQSGRDLICDGHVTLRNAVTGIIEEVFTEQDSCFYSEIILLHAPADVVLQRRANDPNKRRSLDPEQIREELQAERTCSQRMAAQRQMLLHEIHAADMPTPLDRLREILSP